MNSKKKLDLGFQQGIRTLQETTSENKKVTFCYISQVFQKKLTGNKKIRGRLKQIFTKNRKERKHVFYMPEELHDYSYIFQAWTKKSQATTITLFGNLNQKKNYFGS